MKKLFYLLLIILISACELPSSDEQTPRSSPNNPKTIFGQSIKKAKDLNKNLSSQDEVLKKQYEDLNDE